MDPDRELRLRWPLGSTDAFRPCTDRNFNRKLRGRARSESYEKDFPSVGANPGFGSMPHCSLW